MAKWDNDNIILTAVGEEILAKVAAGIGKITVTRVVSGSSSVTPSRLSKLTAIPNIAQTFTIQKYSTTESGSSIEIQVSNESLTAEYNLWQIGVYVLHQDYTGEQLYMVAQATTPDAIPLPTETPLTMNYSLFLQHASTSNVEITPDLSGLVRQEMLSEHIKTEAVGEDGVHGIRYIKPTTTEGYGSLEVYDEDTGTWISITNDINAILNAHVSEVLTDTEGVHGIRYTPPATASDDGVLSYKDADGNWIEIETGAKMEKTTVTFTEATAEENIKSGELVPTLFGKIMHLFNKSTTYDESESSGAVGRDADTLGGKYTALGLDTKFAEMQSNFQSGVDTVYNACVSVGSTPTSKTPTAIASAISTMSPPTVITPLIESYVEGKLSTKIRIALDKKYHTLRLSSLVAPTSAVNSVLKISGETDGATTVIATLTNSPFSDIKEYDVNGYSYLILDISAETKVAGSVPVVLSGMIVM